MLLKQTLISGQRPWRDLFRLDKLVITPRHLWHLPMDGNGDSLKVTITLHLLMAANMTHFKDGKEFRFSLGELAVLS